MPTIPSVVRAASSRVASRLTSAPWLSVPVSGSRRVDSTSSAVWRVKRPWADRKMRNKRTAASIAALSVTMRTSRRTSSSRARIGTPSRQRLTTPTTLPAVSVIGSRSRRIHGLSRSAGGTPASAPGTMAASGRVASAGTGSAASGAVGTAARSVPSERRSSAWRMPPSPPAIADRFASRAARRAGSIGVPIARSLAASPPSSARAFARRRTDARSPSTTACIVTAVKCEVTIVAWAAAVIPTSAMNAPNTSNRRIGRRTRGSVPNTGSAKAPNGRRPEERTGRSASGPPDIRTGVACPRCLRCALAPGLRGRVRARREPSRWRRRRCRPSGRASRACACR